MISPLLDEPLWIAFALSVIGVVVLVALLVATWKDIPRVRRYQGLLDRLDGLAAEVADLSAARSEARKLIDEADVKAARLDAMREELQMLEPRRIELAEVSDRLLREKDELASVRSELSETRAAADEERAALRQAEAAAEASRGKLERTEEERRQVSNQLQELKQEASALGVQVASKQEEFRATSARLEALRSEARDLEATVRGLHTQEAALLPRIENLKQQEADHAARMRALEAQLEVFEKTYSGTLEALRTQWEASLGEWRRSQDLTLEQIERQWKELREHIDKAVDAISGTWKSLRPPTAASSAEKYKELWEPVLRREALDDAPTQRAEGEALADTRSYLEDLGLVYSDRTLRAFHTCLKVNEMSPLTVLAGISGTGKSELPRRYAEGMGIHFLSVAVQPRWDSPQDLFGFYNYVESRYKGTELARVLVQAERFNSKNFEEKVPDPLGDRMVLVLLDEMNLARVEYYFSEFLSRLETRRGVDPRDPDQRRAAEILFEMGALGDDEKEVRVFPDTNILFTGTMNEDETTQTLSDKVLDRANVLRFGKPSRLALSDVGTNRPPVATNLALSFENWRSWQRSPAAGLGGADRTTLDGWTHDLNEAMGAVGRPFGHRVALAIEHYAANYPLRTDQGLRHSFADQIEQRIMPRLRGLDPRDHAVSTAFDRIERLVEKLDDPALHAAFSDGRTGDLFLWAGVDRDAGDS